MSRLTRKEFAAICHTSVSVINVNVKRGNLIVEGKKIDTNQPSNKEFFNRYQSRFEKERKKENESKNKSNELQISDPEIASYTNKNRNKKQESKKDDFAKDSVNDYVLRKKKADTLLQERKAEVEKMKLDKLAGKLIPVDLVFQVLNIHNKSIFATFQSDVENLASVFCEILAEGDRSKLSEVTQKISEKLIDTVDKSKELAELEIDNAVAEYAETRSRGERK